MAVELPADAEERVRQLRTSADQLASFADTLPGPSEADYRQRTSQALDELGQLLRLAKGPDANGAFRVRLYSIFEAARQLRNRPAEYPVETQVTGALRSAHGALREIARDQFAASAELTEQLEQLDASLRPLETDRGALHRVSSANSLRLAVKAVQTMADLYTARIPTTAPAAQEDAPAVETPEAPETTETPAVTEQAQPEQAEPAQPATPAQEEPQAPAEQPAQPQQPAEPREELNK